jgi:hypothetical protein
MSRDPHDDGGWEAWRRHNGRPVGALPGSRPRVRPFAGASESAPWITPPPSETATSPFPVLADAPGVVPAPGLDARPAGEVPGFEFDDRRSRQGRHRAGGQGGGGRAAGGQGGGGRATGGTGRPGRLGDRATRTRLDGARHASVTGSQNPSRPVSGLFGQVPLMREPLASVPPLWSEADTVPGFEFSAVRPRERSVFDLPGGPESADAPAGSAARGPARASHAKRLLPSHAKRLLPGMGKQDDRSRFCLCGWQLALMVLAVLIAVTVAIALVVSANNGPQKSVGALDFAPAMLAGRDFTPYAAANTRGITEAAGRVASFGSEVVAVGAQTGRPVSRAQFFVSVNGGQSWALGSVTAPGGGAPAAGHAAAFVAGGQGKWAAIGPDSVWTSADGQAWTLASGTGLPMRAGDQITVLKRTASGFLAAGANVSGGGRQRSTPVIFLSASGSGWRRLDSGQLGLAADGRVLDIRLAASRGNLILIAGDVATPQTAGKGRSRHTVTVITGGAWLSDDGGTRWKPVEVPAGGGALPQFSDAAVAGNTFVLVRPAMVDGVQAADVYKSGNGTAWSFAATLTASDGFTPSLMNGGPVGAVLTGYSGPTLTAFFSRDGARWQRSQVLGSGTEVVSGVAMTGAGAVISAGTGAAGTGGGQELITTTDQAASADTRTLSMSAIAGGTQPQLTVNAIAARDGAEVAAGSANGFPATWFSANGGRTWRLGSGAAPAVLDRPGLQQLTSVTGGSAGWVAVGGVTAAAAEHPVVLTSAGGVIWSAADGERAFAGDGLYTQQVAARDGVYVIVGYQQVPVPGQRNVRTIAASWWSAGLSGWQRAGGAVPGALDGGGNEQMLAVTATRTGFVAVGSRDGVPAAWTSAGGRTWTQADVPLPAGATGGVLQRVAADGGTVIAMGAAYSPVGSVPFWARSADGGSVWSVSLLPAHGGRTQVTALAAAGSTFIATGTFAEAPGQENVVLWTSPGGTAWAEAKPSGEGLASPGVQAIAGLAAYGRTVTGVGFTASPAGEQPILWQLRIPG